MAKAKRNWIQEERRKTLGDWVFARGNPWFPREPPPLRRGTGQPSCASRRARPGSGGQRQLVQERLDG